jgi:hypothetical protein
MDDQQSSPVRNVSNGGVVPVRVLPTAQLPRATHSGILLPGRADIPCYVLNDGRRLILLAGILKGLGMASGTNRQGLDRISDFLAGNRIKAFVSNELEKVIGSPQHFIRLSDSTGEISYGSAG